MLIARAFFFRFHANANAMNGIAVFYPALRSYPCTMGPLFGDRPYYNTFQMLH